MNILTRFVIKPAVALVAISASASFALASPEQAEGDKQASQTEKKVSVVERRYDKPYEEAVSSSSSPSPLQSDKHKQQKQRYTTASKTYAQVSQSYADEYWIYDSWVTLDADIDYDGYYSRFTVEFDADTIYASAPVYAVVYLGNNDTYDAIHVTSNFEIYGEESSDSFVLENTLLSGFPPQEYDLLIELYDAYSDTLVAYSDSYHDGDLYRVSLESDEYEYRYEDTVVVVEEHGGTMGWLSLTLLFGAMLVLRARRN